MPSCAKPNSKHVVRPDYVRVAASLFFVEAPCGGSPVPTIRSVAVGVGLLTAVGLLLGVAPQLVFSLVR